MVPLETLGTVSYSTSIATMAVSLAVSTQHTNVRDGQTLHDGIGKSSQVKSSRASREKNA